MVQYRRNRVPGGTYFFTVALADRGRSDVDEDHIGRFGDAFRDCRCAIRSKRIAIAVLPEHLHCIWAMPDGDADYSARWSIIKRIFTRGQHQMPRACAMSAFGNRDFGSTRFATIATWSPTSTTFISIR